MSTHNAVSLALARLSELRRLLNAGRLLEPGDIEFAVSSVLPGTRVPLIDLWGKECRGHWPIDRAVARVILAEARLAVIAARAVASPGRTPSPARP